MNYATNPIHDKQMETATRIASTKIVIDKLHLKDTPMLGANNIVSLKV